MHSQNTPARTATPDDELGMTWWNNLTQNSRADWLRTASTFVPAEAWAYFKSNRADEYQEHLGLLSPAKQTGAVGLAAPSPGPVEGIYVFDSKFAELPGAIIDGHTQGDTPAASRPFGRFQGGYFLVDSAGLTTFTKFSDFANCLQFVMTVSA